MYVIVYILGKKVVNYFMHKYHRYSYRSTRNMSTYSVLTLCLYTLVLMRAKLSYI